MARYSPRGRLDLDLPKARLTKENLREAAVVLKYVRPYRGLLIAACWALILSSSLGLCFPFLAGTLMDAATAETSSHIPPWLPHNINMIALLMLCLILMHATLAFFQVSS